jgi:Short C-terminal domain
MLRRRRGMGLLGAAAVGGVAYAAGNSAAKGRAAEQDQNEQLAYLQAQQAEQARQAQAAQMAAATAQAASAPTAAPSMDEKIAQLQQLASLKTAGVLTEEEFAAQKARILAT